MTTQIGHPATSQGSAPADTITNLPTTLSNLSAQTIRDMDLQAVETLLRFEARAKSKAGSALRALAALSAKNVSILLADGTEMVIPAEELAEQQKFVVRPGQTIAADGLVVEGSAAVDTSVMTGEAKPVRATPGSSVIGGTIVLDGRLIVEAAAVGADVPDFPAARRFRVEAGSVS